MRYRPKKFIILFNDKTNVSVSEYQRKCFIETVLIGKKNLNIEGKMGHQDSKLKHRKEELYTAI